METAPIRLGIVGCGGLTQTVHIPCVASLEAFRVVAVCDLREEWQVFARAIREAGECHANVEDAWQAMRIIEALNESLREGRPVALDVG
jgi:predicted dehydrogenase